jgi:hypothetical protein
MIDPSTFDVLSTTTMKWDAPCHNRDGAVPDFHGIDLLANQFYVMA